jgi:hypothetical protein
LPGGVAAALAFAAAALVAATLLPLGTWAVAVAGFGLWHVFVQLRYGKHLGGVVGGALVGGLGVIVALRLALLTSLLPVLPWSGGATSLELALVAALALVGAALARRLGRVVWLAALASAALVAGLTTAPTPTILLLAALHNLTPIGFLAEALPANERRRGLLVASALLLGVPALVATGLPWQLATAAGLGWPEASLLDTSGLGAAIATTLPAGWLDPSAELHAFSALLVAQLLHYAAVIHVLPRLTTTAMTTTTTEPATPALPWSMRLAMAAAIAGLFGLFVADFGVGRSVYGLFAAVHAWLELPLLLALLAPMVRHTAAPAQVPTP